jgi:hypothetical protein
MINKPFTLCPAKGNANEYWIEVNSEQEWVPYNHNKNINFSTIKGPSQEHFFSFASNDWVDLCYLPKLPDGILLGDLKNHDRSSLTIIHTTAPFILMNALPLPIIVEIYVRSFSSHINLLGSNTDKYSEHSPVLTLPLMKFCQIV